MRIFDPHIHMTSRTTDDYESMAAAGVRALVEPAFWLGQPRTNQGSFADYFDPEHVEFGPLRVINEDYVKPGSGFGMHGHRDMEIITYILAGALQHRDSMGNGSVIRPGNVQRMSAGTGVLHSEFNPSDQDTVHLLQIWIQPSQRGVTPSYEEVTFADADKRGRLRVIASPDGREGSVRIHQDAQVFAGLFDGEEHAERAIAPGRRAYVHMARGEANVRKLPRSMSEGATSRPGRFSRAPRNISCRANECLWISSGPTPWAVSQSRTASIR